MARHLFPDLYSTVEGYCARELEYGWSSNHRIFFNSDGLFSENSELAMAVRMNPKRNHTLQIPASFQAPNPCMGFGYDSSEYKKLAKSKKKRFLPWYLLNGDSINNQYRHHLGYTFGLFVEMPRVSFSALNAAGLCVEAKEDEELRVPHPNLILIDMQKDSSETYDVKEGTIKHGRKIHIEGWKKAWPRGTVFTNVYDNGTLTFVHAHVIGSVLLKFKRSFYICARDENMYFISKLPRPVKTLPDAFSCMKPDIIRKIERLEIKRTQKYFRQGEWFFFRYVEGKRYLTPELISKIDSFLSRNGNPKKKLFDHYYLLPRKYGDSKSYHMVLYGRMISKQFHICFGTVKHVAVHGMPVEWKTPDGDIHRTKGDWYALPTDEHKHIRLENILHVAVMNTTIGDWSAKGEVD